MYYAVSRVETFTLKKKKLVSSLNLFLFNVDSLLYCNVGLVMLCLNNKYLREVITVELLCLYVSVINVVSVEKRKYERANNNDRAVEGPGSCERKQLLIIIRFRQF